MIERREEKRKREERDDFFFNDTATTEIYTLSLHDALPISAPYPDGMVQLLSVGIYLNGEFWPFTKQPNLSLYPVDETDGIFEGGDNEGVDIPTKGFGFSSKGSNVGYWAEDTNACLIYVRNYRWDKINSNYTNNTSNLTGKIIVRYKTTGIDCAEDICVPYEYRELIISLVTFRFMKKNIPVQTTNYKLQLQQMDIDTRQEEFYELTTGIHNFWEVKDAIYSSLNTVARR